MQIRHGTGNFASGSETAEHVLDERWHSRLRRLDDSIVTLSDSANGIDERIDRPKEAARAALLK